MPNLNELVSQYQNGDTSIINDIFAGLYAERRRFIHESKYVYFTLSEADLEAVFDDTVMETVTDFKNVGQYIGFLRLRLASRAKDACRKEIRVKMAEREHAQKVTPFTRNPLLVKQHDVEFRDYLSRLHPTLRQACELLETGMSMKAVAQQLGYSDQRTLKGRLQKAFGDFMDRH